MYTRIYIPIYILYLNHILKYKYSIKEIPLNRVHLSHCFIVLYSLKIYYVYYDVYMYLNIV